jgi:uncharacterized protein (TIGR03435 family)
MAEMDDIDLLAAYSARGSEAAFTALTERYVRLVYSAALRQVRDPHLAEEVTQVVFVLLARKAQTFRKGVILSAWLLRATRFTCTNLLVSQYRRVRREQQAVQMQTTSTDDSSWEQIAPLLDEAMSRLGEKDRNALALRFFEQKSLEEVGVALGVDAGTAQKRVWRAVDKLRQYFSRHGAAFSAATITAALSAHAIHGVPSELAATIAATAALKGTAASASTANLIKGTLKLMAWTKIKTAVVAGVAACLVVGTTVTVMEIKTPPDYSWEVQDTSDRAFTGARPQLTILPTKFHPQGNWRAISAPDGRCMGIQVTPKKIIQLAYSADMDSDLRTKVSVPLPNDEYDFICNLRQSASAALRQAITTKFGVTANRQMIETNVLVLSIRDPNAGGLKPVVTPPGVVRSQGLYKGHASALFEPIQHLVGSLEGRFRVPVIDQTGLTGNFAYELNWDEPDARQRNNEGLKQALIDQLGLELTPKIQPVEMLVIEKAK